MKRILSLILLSAMLMLLLVSCGETQPELQDIAEIVVKDYGTIVVQLDRKNAPITVENFEKLATSGFYDGLTFHRVMAGFMAQSGDPNGNGTGGNIDENGNRVTIKGEFAANGVKNPISHNRGTISMARASYSMDSASSQFFIVVGTNCQYLDGQYAAFGQVIEGMDVLDKIVEKTASKLASGMVDESIRAVIETIRIK